MLNTESKQIKSLWVLYCKTCEIMKNQWTYEWWDSRNVGRASRSVRFKRQASILVRVWFIERIRKRLAKLAACLSAWLLLSFLGLSVDGVIIPYWLVGCFAGQLIYNVWQNRQQFNGYIHHKPIQGLAFKYTHIWYIHMYYVCICMYVLVSDSMKHIN